MEKLNENIEWEIKMGKKWWEGRMGNTNGKNIKPFPIFFLSPFQTLYWSPPRPSQPLSPSHYPLPHRRSLFQILSSNLNVRIINCCNIFIALDAPHSFYKSVSTHGCVILGCTYLIYNIEYINISYTLQATAAYWIIRRPFYT